MIIVFLFIFKIQHKNCPRIAETKGLNKTLVLPLPIIALSLGKNDLSKQKNLSILLGVGV